ncbi:adenylate/guanylate cyclase domain-containing protein [candidate division FCPU426 bacterium]|nr:adenylate/guanylate cyclase domain-containing protein [candidate division FCPU426 bacterium]
MRLKEYLAKTSRAKMAVSIALFMATLFVVLDYFGFGITYENKMLDFRFMLREPAGPSLQDKIVIVAIDDQTLNTLKLRWPWPRSVFARAIDNLSKAGARVVAFDMIFSEPSGKELARQDQVLGSAIIRSRSWIVLGSKFYAKKTPVGLETSYVAPIPKIDPGKTHVGYVNYWHDEDGIVRHAALLRKHQGTLYQSFVLKILSRYHNIKEPGVILAEQQLTYGPLKIRVERNAKLLINYRGGPGSFQIISFDNLLDGEVFKGLLESGVFKDRIVLIGPTFLEAQDNHPTPYLRSGGGLTAGVEIHAHVLDTIMQQKYFVQANWAARWSIFYLMALFLALVGVRLRPGYSFLVLLAAIFIYGGAASWLFMRLRWVLPMFTPMFMLTIGTYLPVLAYRLVTEERQSRFIKDAFARYVSPKVVEELVKNPEALQLGGKKQTVTVLFSDIRGFTSLSERLRPEQVVELLNEYFQTWTDIIFKYDGMVDKFIGDAVMAIFGAPVAHPDDPIRAVRAALDMKQALARLQERWRAEGKYTFNIGVGINTGEAIVGNMGSRQAMGYTVIGDTVNLASRLEGKTKDLEAFLLVSQRTYEEVKRLVAVREHAGIMVKGKAEPLTVYEVLGLQV